MSHRIPSSHLCRWPLPDRETTRDGVTYCDTCGELLADDRDELIAFLIVKVDELSRVIEHLTAQAQERTAA